MSSSRMERGQGDVFGIQDRSLRTIKRIGQVDSFIRKFNEEYSYVFTKKERNHIENYAWKSFSNSYPNKISCISFFIGITLALSSICLLYLDFIELSRPQFAFLCLVLHFLFRYGDAKGLKKWRNFRNARLALEEKLAQISLDRQILANLFEAYDYMNRFGKRKKWMIYYCIISPDAKHDILAFIHKLLHECQEISAEGSEIPISIKYAPLPCSPMINAFGKPRVHLVKVHKDQTRSLAHQNYRFVSQLNPED